MLRNFKKICEQNTFEELYLNYSDALRCFIFVKTQDVDLAEDILQDSFIKLWDNCSRVDYNKVKSYLYKVATNLFLNLKKHEKVKQNYKEHNNSKITSESPEFIYLEQEFLEKLENAINDLSEKQKEVFLLSRIEKKKYREISELLGISIKAVEKRMHSALVKLRSKIDNL